MTRKKMLFFLAVLSAMIVLFAGCANKQNTSNQPAGTPSTSPTPALTESTAPLLPENPSPAPAPMNASEAQHAQGRYVGQIDNNSIEVLIDGEPTALRLNETAQMQVSALTEGQLIGFIYEVNDAGQKTIIRFDETPQTMVAVYAGQMDPHTIEVTRDNSPLAFQLTGDALTQVNSLNVGDTIEITFTMNASGQNVASALIVQ